MIGVWCYMCDPFVWCDKYGSGGDPFVWCHMEVIRLFGVISM